MTHSISLAKLVAVTGHEETQAQALGSDNNLSVALAELLARINPNYNGYDHDCREYYDMDVSASQKLAQVRAVPFGFEACLKYASDTGRKIYAVISHTTTEYEAYYCEHPCAGHSRFHTRYVRTVRVSSYAEFQLLAEGMNYYDDGYGEECWGYSARFVIA